MNYVFCVFVCPRCGTNAISPADAQFRCGKCKVQLVRTNRRVVVDGDSDDGAIVDEIELQTSDDPRVEQVDEEHYRIVG